MDNKRFIATIRACKSLNELEPEVLDKLETSELDLKYLYTKIGSLFKINTSAMSEVVLILRLLEKLDTAYRLRSDKDTFIDSILNILDLHSSISVGKDWRMLNVWFYGWHSYKSIELSQSLNVLRAILFYPNVKLKINNKIHEFTVSKNNDLLSILIDDKDYGSIGGIFIKDKKLEYVKVYNDNDYRVLLNRVIKGDHDLVILPNPSYRDTNVDDTIDMLSLNNNDYLEYLLLYGDLVEGSINTLNLMQIYNSSMKYAKIMSLFRNRGIVDNVWLSLLKEVDDRIKEENKVEEVYDVLKLKFPIHKLLDEIRLKKYVSEIQKHPEWDFDRVVKFIKEE